MPNVQRIAAATVAEIRRQDRDEDFGYNPLSGGNELNYRLKLNYHDIVENVNELFLKNPLASRVIRAKTNYVMGDGLRFKANDEEVQKVLEHYWKSNKWDIKQLDRINDLSINGEYIIIPDVGDNAGLVTIGVLLPSRISERFKPEFGDEITAFKIDDKDKEYRVIAFNEAEQAYEGEAFYFAINKTLAVDFGISDLFSSRDWMRMYDKSLFATMSRVGMILSFVWDVLIKTNDPKTLKEKMKQLQMNPPAPGSVNIHNESQEWKAVTPNLQGGDMDKIYRLLKGQCLMESGTPEFVLGLGGDVNLATARTMLKPYFLDIKARQRYVKYMFTAQFDYVIWQAKNKEMLNGVEDFHYELGLQDPDSEKINEYADSLLKLANATVILMTNGLLEEDDAKNIINMVFTMLGVEYETDIDKKTDDYVDRVAKAYMKMKAMENKGNGRQTVKSSS